MAQILLPSDFSDQSLNSPFLSTCPADPNLPVVDHSSDIDAEEEDGIGQASLHCIAIEYF